MLLSLIDMTGSLINYIALATLTSTTPITGTAATKKTLVKYDHPN